MPLGLRELFKSLVFLVTKYRDPELMQTIIELQAQVMDVMDTKENLSHAVNDLQKKLSLRESIHFKEPLFYFEGNPTPLCPRCWQVDGKTVFLISSMGMSRRLILNCSACPFVIDKPSK